jgi:zinc/manganese transport system ATP-binding protein
LHTLNNTQAEPIVSISSATLRFGSRTLWHDLTLDVRPGEFIAILGPNGTGKTSLLKALLGLNKLSGGTITIGGEEPRRGNDMVGYVPQQKGFDRDLPIRGRELVHFGLDGHRFGLVHHTEQGWQRVDEVIREVDAESYANKPIGLMSGGEQQRLRIAQALLSKPRILLCDEPLLSLDLKRQQAVSQLINTYRKRQNMAVIFVTHDINPILPLVDRVLYLAAGKWTVGAPDDVLTTQTLTDLYGLPVDVVRVRDHIIVVNTGDQTTIGGHHLHSNNGEHE